VPRYAATKWPRGYSQSLQPKKQSACCDALLDFVDILSGVVSALDIW